MELIEYLSLVETYKPQISEFIKNCISSDVVIEYKREIIDDKINYYIILQGYTLNDEDKDNAIYKFIEKLQKLGFKIYGEDVDYLELRYSYEKLSIIDEIIKKEEGVDVRKLRMEHDRIVKFCVVFRDILSKSNYVFKEEKCLDSIRIF